MLDQHLWDCSKAKGATIRNGLTTDLMPLNVSIRRPPSIVRTQAATTVSDLANGRAEGNPTNGFGNGRTRIGVSPHNFGPLKGDVKGCGPRPAGRSTDAVNSTGDPLRIILSLHRVQHAGRRTEGVDKADQLTRIADPNTAQGSTGTNFNGVNASGFHAGSIGQLMDTHWNRQPVSAQGHRQRRIADAHEGISASLGTSSCNLKTQRGDVSNAQRQGPG